MPIFACGINHKTAPVALREKLVFAPEKLPLYLQDLQGNENIREAVLLSTCNRSELYCQADDSKQVFNWFLHQHAISPQELTSAWYCHQNQQAVEHIMQVACGLDSMVLGEPQILGQMKEAFSESCAAGAVGSQFNRLFQQVFAVAKEVRTNTSIGACPVSLASAAVNLAKKEVSKKLEDARILLIGAGDTIQLVLRYLISQQIKNITITTRNKNNAEQLAQKYAINTASFEQLTDALQNADMVISATGSTMPIITKTHLPQNHPLCLIDLAVPRDVDPVVAELSGIKLFSIDDLKNLIQHNLAGRGHAAEKARDIIILKSMEFMIWLKSFDQMAATIHAFRKQMQNTADTELSKALKQIERGENSTEVLMRFSQALTNKLLHYPSVQLRQAGMEGRTELLQLAQQLFAVPE